MSTPRTANELRRAFTGFFADRDHTVVPSAKLIPHDPTVLFTVAGMVPFKSYFTGDETPPYKRATTVQKCARAGGKHNDLDDVGRTARHLVFFEMLGNFSFGDYFKLDAIPFAWDFVTNTLGFDPEKLWVTVHDSDDEAEEIWLDVSGLPKSRIQRMGDKDNFWQMGETGPCGPCSEIYIDKGPQWGPDGGPAHGGDERFLEFWNLVFMQFDQSADGTRTPLPKPSIDTGAGLERILCLLQDVETVWDTDVMAPLIEQASSLTGKAYGNDERTSVSLRILAEHARSGTMLVNDGVWPSNDGRGYVLRRIIRRAVRHAYLQGADQLVMPKLVPTVIDVMGEAYPDLAANADLITGVMVREEEQFRRTLKHGMGILSGYLGNQKTITGSQAFELHDTYGFPLEVTEEITAEHGVSVDKAGFETEMAEQRRRAKEARKGGGVDEGRMNEYRAVIDQFATTEFVGYQRDEVEARVLAVLDAANDGTDGRPLVEVFLDRSPFYAESGGQVGDTGTITTETGVVEVLDTTFALPGLRRHLGVVTSGVIAAGQEATAAIDVDRRAAIRKNHTATHLLHWALREVLGEHVKQQGSMVAPERLRFDFSHFAPVSAEDIERIEQLVNTETLVNAPVRAYETTKPEAEALGAIAFFGDKYGDVVRVLEAGRRSMELCGGTHVSATGDIGLIKVVSEGSIGSGIRRIEAVTGVGSVALLQRDERVLAELARKLNTTADNVLDGVDRKLDELDALRKEIKALRTQLVAADAAGIASTAVDGVVVHRVDGLATNDLRDLAANVRQQAGVRIVVLIGTSDTGGVAVAGASKPDAPMSLADLVKPTFAVIGGGGNLKGDLVSAGGKNTAGIDEALAMVRAAAGIA
ncbi:MAG: alanine--tRNA ligase [Acidimicrobiia bacterium]